MPEVVEHERFGKIRVVMIEGEPWFVGKGVAAILDYSNKTNYHVEYLH